MISSVISKWQNQNSQLCLCKFTDLYLQVPISEMLLLRLILCQTISKLLSEKYIFLTHLFYVPCECVCLSSGLAEPGKSDEQNVRPPY